MLDKYKQELNLGDKVVFVFEGDVYRGKIAGFPISNIVRIIVEDFGRYNIKYDIPCNQVCKNVKQENKQETLDYYGIPFVLQQEAYFLKEGNIIKGTVIKIETDAVEIWEIGNIHRISAEAVINERSVELLLKELFNS